MKRTNLTPNEHKVLYGLTKYPHISDSELSTIIQVKMSTLTSIKRRLKERKLFKTLTIPLINRLGCELLSVIYMQYNPVIPLEERVQTTKKTIEVFDEIFFSAGEQEKGFSISLAKNYTDVERINEIRTETFGQMGLLEDEYPHEVIFPFETSHIDRFFDYSRLLHQTFSLKEIDAPQSNMKWFTPIDCVDLSIKERRVYIALVEHPDATAQQIADVVGLSRHTVARMKERFFTDGLLRQIVLPHLAELGFELLVFSHITFNLHRFPSTEETAFLDTPSTVFFSRRKFEAVLISAYQTYQEYKEDEMKKIRYLKEKNLIVSPPVIQPYSFNRMVNIKDFTFAPIAKKVVATLQ